MHYSSNSLGDMLSGAASSCCTARLVIFAEAAPSTSSRSCSRLAWGCSMPPDSSWPGPWLPGSCLGLMSSRPCSCRQHCPCRSGFAAQQLHDELAQSDFEQTGGVIPSSSAGPLSTPYINAQLFARCAHVPSVSASQAAALHVVKLRHGVPLLDPAGDVLPCLAAAWQHSGHPRQPFGHEPSAASKLASALPLLVRLT